MQLLREENKMRRYRIEQYGENYYPQHTLGLFWWNYYFKDVGYQTREVVKFNTLIDAENFITENKRIIH